MNTASPACRCFFSLFYFARPQSGHCFMRRC